MNLEKFKDEFMEMLAGAETVQEQLLECAVADVLIRMGMLRELRNISDILNAASIDLNPDDAH